MKTAQIIHNPNAGGDGPGEKELTTLIKSKGFNCIYTSAKQEDWEIDTTADFIVIAGGDGTIRQVAKKMLQKDQVSSNVPLAILPLGTANNISKAFHLPESVDALIHRWHKWKIKKFDVGRLSKQDFFLESAGFGVFPKLMAEMEKIGDSTTTDGVDTALNLLLQLVHTYKARKCKITIDKCKYTGRFLLVEVMNNPSIGPNLYMNSSGKVDDGDLEVILIPDAQRSYFASYVERRLHGSDEPFFGNVLRGKNIKIKWSGKDVHIDDEFIMSKANKMEVNVQSEALSFLV